MARIVLITSLCLTQSFLLCAQNTSDYGYFKTITIDASHVAGTHSNLPFLVSESDIQLAHRSMGGSLWSHDGYDILFTDVSGTSILKHQIESYNSTTGTINVWVNPGIISNIVDTEIRMYFGSQYNTSVNRSTEDTWSAEYKAVYHFENNSYRDASRSATEVDNGFSSSLPRTSNSPIHQAGQFDGSSFMDNDGDNLDIRGDLTLEAWINPVNLSPGADRPFITMGGTSEWNNANYNYLLGLKDGYIYVFQEYDSGQDEILTSTVAIEDSVWHHVAMTRNAFTQQIIFYYDGIQLGDPVPYVNPPNGGTNFGTSFKIGSDARTGPINYYQGLIDEVRVSNVVKSHTWLQTNYNAMADHVQYYNMGPLVCNLNLEYPSSDFCRSASDVVIPTVLTGSANGYFSEPTGNVVFNDNSTGEIDLYNSSTGGLYDITFTDNFGCEAIYPITIQGPIAAPMQDIVVCTSDENPSILLEAKDPAPYTGFWDVTPGDAAFSLNTSHSTTFEGKRDKSYKITWTVVDPECGNVSETFDVLFTSSTNDFQSDAGKDTIVCGLPIIELYGNTPPNDVAGEWLVNSDAVEPFDFIPNNEDPNATFTGQSGETYTLTWSLSDNDGGCNSATDVNITFLTPSIANAGADQFSFSNCGTTTTTLDANTVTSGTGQWSKVSGDLGSFSNIFDPKATFNGIAGEHYVLQWTVNSPNCPANTDDVSIQFDDTDFADAGGDISACNGETDIVLNGISFDATSETGEWSLVPGFAFDGALAQTGSNTTNFSGSLGNSYKLEWKVNRNGCVSRDTIDVHFYNSTSSLYAGADQVNCGETTTNLNGHISTDHGQGTWTVLSAHTTAPIIEDIHAYNSKFTGTAGETYTLEWSAGGGTCVYADIVEISFPIVSTTDAGADRFECDNTILSTTDNGTDTYEWELLQGGGNISDPNSSSTVVNSLSSGTNIFKLTQNQGVCITTDTVKVLVDSIAPTFTVPADIEITRSSTCTADTAAIAAQAGYPSNIVEECEPTIVYIDAITESCDGSFIISRKWVASDKIGNTTIGTQEIQVTDDSPPTFTLPADIDVYSKTDCTLDTMVIVTGTITVIDDNCDSNPTTSYRDTYSNLGCTNIINRIWTVTDDCQNSIIDTQYINIIDTIKPTFTTPRDTLIYLDTSCDYDTSATGLGTPTSLLSGCGHPLYTNIDLSSYTVSKTVIDETTESVDETEIIVPIQFTTGTDIFADQTIVDFGGDINGLEWMISNEFLEIYKTNSTDPDVLLFQYPVSATTDYAAIIYRGSDYRWHLFIDATSSINSLNKNHLITGITSSDRVWGNSPSGIGLRRSNSAGSSVKESIPFLGSLPSNQIDVYVNQDLSNYINEDPISYYDITNNSCGRSMDIKRVWSVTESCGNVAVDTQYIQVLDTIKPTFNTPRDTILYFDIACAFDTTRTAIGDISELGDNCDSTPMNIDLGSLSLNYNVSDGDSQSDGDKSVVIPFTFETGTDINTAQTLIDIGGSGVGLEVMIQSNQLWIFHVTPEEGLQSIIGPVDVDPLIEYATIIYRNDSGNWFMFFNEGSSDISSLNSSHRIDGINHGYNLWSIGSIGIANRNLDAATTGNLTSGPFLGTSMSTSLDIYTDEDLSAFEADPSYTESYNDISLSTCGQAITFKRVWKVEDSCGNVAVDTQYVEVLDTIKPTFTVPIQDTVWLDDNCVLDTIPASTGNVTIYNDNCSDDTNIVINYTNAYVATPPSIERTWRVTDHCDNFTEGIQTIIILDTIPPVIECPSDITGSTDSNCEFSVPSYINDLISLGDNCAVGDITYTQIPAEDSIIDAGIHEITIIATDAFDNSDTCTFILDLDYSIPTQKVLCGQTLTNQTTKFNSNLTESYTCIPYNTPGKEVYYQVDVPPGNYVMNVILSNVEDPNDSQIEVLWMGSTCPINNCEFATTYNIADSTFANGTNKERFVAIGPDTYYLVLDTKSTSGIEKYDIEFECFDSAIELDRSNSCALDTDNDGVLPTVNGSQVLEMDRCQTVTICDTVYIKNKFAGEWLDSLQMILGECYTNIRDITPTGPNSGFYNTGEWNDIYDASSNTIFWEFEDDAVLGRGDGLDDGSGYSYTYGCDSLTEHLYTFCFTADISPTCGGDSLLNITLIVADDEMDGLGRNTGPGIDIALIDDYTLRDTLEVGLGESIISHCSLDTLSVLNAYSSLNYVWKTADGNILTRLDSSAIIIDQAGTYIVESDGTGCVNSDTIIVLQDNTPPTFTRPDAKTLYRFAGCVVDTSATLAGAGAVSDEMDNSGAILKATYKDSFGTPTCDGDIIITRRWNLVDGCGNIAASTGDQIITVKDTIAPTFTTPDDLLVYFDLDCELDTSRLDVVWASDILDNCDNTITTSFEDISIATDSVHRVWTVIDDCGNSRSNIQVISIRDTLEPVVTCPAEQTVVANPSSCQYLVGSYVGLTSYTDNCDNGLNIVQNPAAGTILNAGRHAITMTVTDSWGNVGSCTFDLVILARPTFEPIICGSSYTNQRTSGSGSSSFYNNSGCAGPDTYGGDKVYQLTVPNGNYLFEVELENVSDATEDKVEVFWMGADCPISGCPIKRNVFDISDGRFNGKPSNSITIEAPGPGTYFLVIDSRGNGIDNFDVNFSCFRTGLLFDDTNCTGDPDSDGLEVWVNDAQDYEVETCETVNICHEVWVKNLETWEWLDSVVISLGPGYENIRASTTDHSTYEDLVVHNVPGYYASTGNWRTNLGGAGVTNNQVVYDYNHLTCGGCGDGNTNRFSCGGGKDFHFTFCFTADISQDARTNADLIMEVKIIDDGVGGGFISTISGDVKESDKVILDPLVVDAGVEKSICEGDSIQLEGTGSGDRVWIQNGYVSDVNDLNTWVTPTSDTYFVLRGTNDIGCEILDSVQILVDPKPFIDITGDPIFNCVSDTILTLGAVADVEYYWTTNDGNIVGWPYNDTIQIDQAGTYILTATNNINACVSIDSFTTNRDDIIPTFILPRDTTLYRDGSCMNDTSIVRMLEPTGQADNYSSGLTTSHLDHIDIHCPGTYTIARAWSVEDDCGNIAKDTQYIHVIDTIAPTFTEPDDVWIRSSTYTSPGCIADTSVSVTGSDITFKEDNCDPSPVFVKYYDVITNVCGIGGYTVERNWQVTDACGNIATRIQNIFVIDNTPPTFTIPLGDTLYVDTSCAVDTSITALGIPSDEADDCSIEVYESIDLNAYTIDWQFRHGDVQSENDVSLTIPFVFRMSSDAYSTQTIFELGGDEAGVHVRIRNENLEVIHGSTLGTESIVLSTPVSSGTQYANILHRTAAGQWYLFTNIGSTIETLSRSNMITGGISTGQLWGTNPHGVGNINGSSKGTGGHFYGTEPAQPLDIYMRDNLNNYINATANTNTSTYRDLRYPTCEGSYYFERIWELYDACDNIVRDTQKVWVLDTIKPEFTVPNDITVYLDTDCNVNISPSETGTITNQEDFNCTATGSFLITYNDIDTVGNCKVNCIISREWQLADDCGNITRDTQYITITDTIKPTFTTPTNPVVYSDIDCFFDTLANVNNLNIDLNTCTTIDDIIATYRDVIDTICIGSYDIERTWTITDLKGNSTSEVELLQVRDTISPTFTTPDDIEVFLDDMCQVNTDTSMTIGTVRDEQDGCITGLDATYDDEIIPGCSVFSYSINRTWTLTDNCGNSSSDIQVITISDTIRPTFTVPRDTTLFVDINCLVDTTNASTGDVVDEADNNCATSIDAIYSDNINQVCSGSFTISRTWTLTDDCNNVTEKIQTITVEDKTKPTFTAPADIELFLDDDCAVDASPSGLAGDVIDAADGCAAAPITATYINVDTVGDCTINCIITREWTLLDNCGNVAIDTQYITITDTISPQFTVPTNAVVYSDIDCFFDTSANVNNLNIDLNPCTTIDDIVITYNDIVDTICIGSYDIERTWTITDPKGNSTSEVELLQVRDTISPTFTTPDDIEVFLDETCQVNLDLTIVGDVTDERDGCSTGLDATFKDQRISNCGQTYTILRTWSLTDNCNNSTTSVQTITVLDTILPEFSAPRDTVLFWDLDCNANIAPEATGEVTNEKDNCSFSKESSITSSGIVGSIDASNVTLGINSSNPSTVANSHYLQSISIAGLSLQMNGVYSNMKVPDHYSSDFSTTNSSHIRIMNDGVTVTNISNSDFEVEALAAFQNTNLQNFQALNGHNYTTDSYTLHYNTPALSNPSGFIAITERGGNNQTAVEAFDADGVSLGYITVASSDYIDSDHSADNHQNIEIAIFPIDNIAPIGSSISSLRITLDGNGSDGPDGKVFLFGQFTEIDATYNDVVTTASDGSQIILRTWSLIDECGKSAPDQIQRITVKDTIPPTFTVPNNIDLYLDVDCIVNSSPSTTGDVTDEMDNCTPTVELDATYNDVATVGNCDVNCVITREWILEDASGNITIDTQYITITDTISPQFAVPTNTVVYSDIDCAYDTTANINNLNIDLNPCTTIDDIVITYNDIVDTICIGSYDIERTWTITDPKGNSTNEVELLQVRDTISPTFTTPDDIEVFLDDMCQVNTDTSITVGTVRDEQDGCITGLDATYDDEIIPGCSNSSYSINRTWTLTDSCGNSSTGLQVITISDTIRPTFTVPRDTILFVDVNCFADTTTASTGDVVDEADNSCATTINAIYSDNVNQVCTGSFTITRTWTLTDDCNNVTEKVQTITVEDKTKPTFTTPADIELYLDDDCVVDTSPSGLAGDVIDAADGCAAAPITATYINVDTIGDCTINCIIVRQWTLVDDCGNIARDTQFIAITDTISPIFTTPTNPIIYSDIDCAYDTTADINNLNIDLNSCTTIDDIVITYNDIVDTICIGSYDIERTWTITDPKGNSTSEVELLQVRDTISPTFTTPSNIELYLDAMCQVNTDTSITVGTVRDEQDGCITGLDAAYDDEIIPGCSTSSYSINRTWTLTDSCGNSSTGLQVITISDTIRPTFTVPRDTTLFVDVNCFVDTTTASTGDVVDEADNSCATTINAIYSDNVNQVCTGSFTITRTWTLTDDCNNVTEKIQTITVEDKTKPTFTTPADIELYLDDDCVVDASPSGLAGDVIDAADGCAAAPITATYINVDTVGDCTINCIIVRQWTLIDDCGNIARDTQFISITDTISPTFSTPTNPIIYSDIDCAYDTTADINNLNIDLNPCTSIDDIVITYNDIVDTICIGSYDIERTWTITDPKGNSTSQVELFQVRDTISPTFTTPDDIEVFLDEMCQVNTDTSMTVGTVRDEQDGCITGFDATYDDEIIPGCSTSSYAINRTWTLTDDCGNSSSGLQVITISDTIKPTFTAPIDITLYADDNCNVNDQPNGSAGDVTDEWDNCGTGHEATFADNRIDNCTGSYVIQRTWSLSDDCNNSAADQIQIITVLDTIKPTFTAPTDVTLHIDSDCNVDTTPNGAAGDVIDEQDNCSSGINATFMDAIVGKCDSTCTITRTWILADDCGNTTTRIQIINVADTISPTFSTLPKSFIYGTVDCTIDTIASISDLSIDNNCTQDDLEITYVDEITELCSGNFDLERTWTVTDHHGNSTSEVQLFEIRDTIKPSFTTPDSITLYLDLDCLADTSISNTGMATDIFDGCSSNLLATHSDVKIQNCVEGSYTLERTWTLSDNCGNTSTGLQIITVLDTIKPIFTAPKDTLIYSNINCQIDTTTLSTGRPTSVSDNCTSSPSITYSDNVIANCEGNYDIERTWTISDACSNTEIFLQTIQVRDTISPTFDAPATTAVWLDVFNNLDTSTTATGSITNIVEGCSNTTITYRDSIVEIGSAQVLEEVYRIWSISDECGNSSGYIQSITVIDTLPPTYGTPSSYGDPTAPTAPPVVEVDCSDIPAIDTLDFSDINGVLDITMTESVIDTPCIDRRTIVRAWTATDAVGNQTTVDEIIVVTSCGTSVDANISDTTPCTGEFVTLSGSLNHPVAAFTYYPQWFYRSNPTDPWTQLAGGSQQTVIFPAYNFRAGEYKLAYAADINHLDASECQYESSVLTLSIPVSQSLVTNDSATICEGETYSIGDSTFTQSGNYNVIFSNQNGCDSIVLLELIINELETESINVNMCDGDFYETSTGTRYFESGIYQDTIPSSGMNCDSVLIVNLIFSPVDTFYISESICQGDSIIFNGITLTTTGQYTETFNSQNNCDSTVILDLIINQPTEHDLDITICTGSSYLFDGVEHTSEIQRDAIFEGSYGCDSIVHLDLKVQTEIVVIKYDTTCNQQPVIFEGRSLTESGIYVGNTFTAVHGCDSINELHLYVREPIVNTFEVRPCAGDVYQFKGNSYSDSQTFPENFTSVHGCDSLVLYTFIVGETVQPDPIARTICAGDSLLIGNNYIKSTGNYELELVNTGGCLDSLVTYNITVLDELGKEESKVICAGDSIYLDGAYRKTSGTYISNLQSNSTSGCDSIVTTNLIVEDDIQLWAEDVNVCFGESFNLIVDGAENLTWTNDDLLSCTDCPNPSGRVDQTTTFTATTAGCAGAQESVDIKVTVFQDVKVEVLTPDTILTWGESLVLDAYVSDPFTALTWYDEAGNVLCTNCNRYEITAEQAGVYYVEANGDSGCSIRDEVVVNLRDGCEDGEVIIPNFISPNGDGINDVIEVRYQAIQSVSKMRIFNRWGQIVFKTDDVENDKWDGSVNGSPGNPGVYVYFIEFKCLNGEEVFQKGNITIMR